MCKIISIQRKLRSKLDNISIDNIVLEVDGIKLETARNLVDKIQKDYLAELVKMLNCDIYKSDSIRLKRVPISEIAQFMEPDFSTLDVHVRGKLRKLSIICSTEKSCYLMLSESIALECYRIDVTSKDSDTILCTDTVKL